MFSLHGDEDAGDSIVRVRFDGLEAVMMLCTCLLLMGDDFSEGDEGADAATLISATTLFASARARDTLGAASGFHPSLAPKTPHGDEFGLILWPLGLQCFLPDPVSKRKIGRDLARGVVTASCFFAVATLDGVASVSLFDDWGLRELGGVFAFGRVGVADVSNILAALTIGVKPVCCSPTSAGPEGEVAAPSMQPEAISAALRKGDRTLSSSM